jgi:hypothetical protein
LGNVLEAYQLVESYKRGELKGKLKEIAATLNEESNPVIMLIKHKKEIIRWYCKKYVFNDSTV